MSAVAVSIQSVNDFAACEIVSWSDGMSCIGIEVRSIEGPVIYDYLAVNRDTLEVTRHRGRTGDPTIDNQVH